MRFEDCCTLELLVDKLSLLVMDGFLYQWMFYSPVNSFYHTAVILKRQIQLVAETLYTRGCANPFIQIRMDWKLDRIPLSSASMC